MTTSVTPSAPPPVPTSQAFRDTLGVAATPPGTEDVLAAVMPLLRQVLRVHEQGRVAPLAGVDSILVTKGKLFFENGRCREQQSNGRHVEALQSDESSALEVVEHTQTEQDLTRCVQSSESLDVGVRGSLLERPVYLAGYVSWEHEVDHHDALTDVFVLGLILASVAVDLDLADDAHMRTFVAARRDIRSLNERIHPVLARMIMRMTELNRHKRVQDLKSAIAALEAYRDQGVVGELDLASIAGLGHEKDPAGRRAVICELLRNRLFDVSRRNRLLHFKPSGQTLNLTEVSVPLLLDYKNLATEDLLTWQGKTAESFSQTEPIALGKWLRFEDYPFLPGVLDKIRTRAARDQTEYGFSSLRLVLCFLHWHNLKDAPDERIHTPLLLLPATLARKKGVRDSYFLTPSTDVAEVNPVLRHVFRQLYGIELPQSVDLTQQGSVAALYDVLVRQVEASEPGVSIEYVDKPRIDLIQARVKRRLQSFRKRSRLSGRGVRSYGKIEYSYRQDNFQPLGLRLFSTRVALSPAPMRDMVDAPRPKVFQMAPGVGAREIRREQYALRSDDADAAPHRWAFDVCGVTLGNFNYQKITLVADYSNLLEEGGRPNAAFDALFSSEPRVLEHQAHELPVEEQYTVVPADPSQLQAIARSRNGSSYIIQGPPGTGKSQTITNLIADYVARGKRVLFVCEKRAAIDVVYHRLKQHGLDALSCLIHDSQADKREFIQSLKQTYEDWSATASGQGGPERERCVAALQAQYGMLARLTEVMTSPAVGAQEMLAGLIRRVVELDDIIPDLSAAEKELLPRHVEFSAHREVLLQVASALEAVGAEPVLAKHPVRLLSQAVLTSDRPIEALTRELERVKSKLANLQAGQAATSAGALTMPLRELFARVDLAVMVRPLLEAGLLALVDATSDTYGRLKRGLKKLEKKSQAFGVAREKAAAWREPLAATDLDNAMQMARRFTGMFFRFLFPSFWRLRNLLQSRYDFTATVLPPTYIQVLEQLQAQYDAESEVAEFETQLAEEFGLQELSTVQDIVGHLHTGETPSQAELTLRAELTTAGGEEKARALLASAGDVAALRQSLSAMLQDYEGLAPPELLVELRGLEASVALVPDLVDALRELNGVPSEVRAAAKQLPLTVDAFEAAVCEKAVVRTLRQARDVAKFDAEALLNVRRALEAKHRAFREANSASIVDAAQMRFLEHVRISQTPAAGLTQDEKAIKKIYAAGRRELEHEFGKVMRFRSIRDLMSNRTGAVIRDLKPVWLMSPLSVADTLPCTAEFFDVVIFDEASQIPLEDAVPAIYRAEQTIIVGDQMQLPPTNFFASSRDDEGDRVVYEENEESIEYELDADSLLSHSARSLHSTMLEWHYRSRDETLISFCNEAFYAGRLLTIPSACRQQAPGEIRAADAAAGARGAVAALARAVSFHRLEQSPYEGRRNRKEAGYIAEMVRGLLARGTGLSLGIVAFSEAQQDEIEQALTDLAAQDTAFRTALDAEFEREEDDQFCGLFVKNLENVQGDERDMIILSVCYAPDSKGRMLMNFGPINKNGGEKRLNVIFSRARRHMAVVSSIDYTQITNEYNDGANTLRRYLRYAAAVSRGDADDAASALARMAPAGSGQAVDARADPVKEALAGALRARGLDVEVDVGASRFRCDIVVRAIDREPVAVLIDVDEFYRTGTDDERFRLRPEILEAFGWRVEVVLAKDWLTNPDGVLQRICGRP